MVAGWLQREQSAVIEYLKEKNKVLREQLGGKRLRFSDAQRRRLARRGQLVGRRSLRELGAREKGHAPNRISNTLWKARAR